MDLPGMHAEQKKGESGHLRGRLIAYVRINAPEEGKSPESESTPLEALVRNGILAVQANYIDQRNIRDFFKKEFGISLEKGIQEVIEQARETGGLEGALDPDAVKDRLDSMKNADFIPIPAKVAFFSNEQEMLSQDADIYFLGTFTVLSHAHLCVNAFPILYQAYYREQEHLTVEREISELLGAIETQPGEASEAQASDEPEGGWKRHLLTVLIPRMIYTRGGDGDHERSVEEFRVFMEHFGFPQDTQAVVDLIESASEFDAVTLRKLELLVSKVEALQQEDYEKLESIKRELAGL